MARPYGAGRAQARGEGQVCARWEAEALVKIGTPAVAPLITALSDGNRDVRKNAAEVLGNLYLSGQLDDFSKNLISQQLHLLRMLNQT